MAKETSLPGFWGGVERRMCRAKDGREVERVVALNLPLHRDPGRADAEETKRALTHASGQRLDGLASRSCFLTATYLRDGQNHPLLLPRCLQIVDPTISSTRNAHA